MNEWWITYLSALAVAFGFACLLTPVCRCVAWRLNILDKPLSEGHKMHSQATALLGGAAVCLGWLLAIGTGLVFLESNFIEVPESFPEIFSTNNPALKLMLVIIVCSISFVLVGLWDDRRAMSAKVKISLQAFLCYGTAAAGVRIDMFSNQYLSILLSGFILLTVLNAVNFLDNMDGLCCGVGAICSLAFMVAAGMQGQYLVALLAAVTSGACFGFYIYNCNPASIFLGDSGSHFVGYMLGVLGVMVTYSNGSLLQASFPLIIPILILAVPLFDLASVVVIRTRHGKPVYVGDHNHISHRFVKMGFSRRSSVLLVHAISLVFCAAGLALIRANYAVMALILTQVIALLIFMTILHSRQKFSEQK
jgi:UDP-GlcNAc:undecaprenyl-phosphate/decaprenyl-phosphate GlcNAc-1-phosphate transferase